MNPLSLRVSSQAKAEFLKVHCGVLSEGYFFAMEILLTRAKNLASGLCHASREDGLDPTETAALAFIITEQIESAHALLSGLHDDLMKAANGVKDEHQA